MPPSHSPAAAATPAGLDIDLTRPPRSMPVKRVATGARLSALFLQTQDAAAVRAAERQWSEADRAVYEIGLLRSLMRRQMDAAAAVEGMLLTELQHAIDYTHAGYHASGHASRVAAAFGLLAGGGK